MGQKDTVMKLPREAREELEKRIVEGRDTLDTLIAWLRKDFAAFYVSRSAVHRYAQKITVRRRAADLIAAAAEPAEITAKEEAIDLMLELATLRLREIKLVDKLRSLGIV